MKFTLPKIGFTRYKRIENYISLISENITVSDEKDQKIIRDIEVLIKERLSAVRVLYFVITISYIGIYFSIVSFYLRQLGEFEKITQLLNLIFGFFGTTLFLITLFFANKLSNLYYQDLNLLASHLITIYNKYKPSKDKDMFEGMNDYDSFINFIKKRY